MGFGGANMSSCPKCGGSSFDEKEFKQYLFYGAIIMMWLFFLWVGMVGIKA